MYRDDVKPYFITNKYPTQSQFWEMLDKVLFNDDNICGMTQAALLILINSKASKDDIKCEEITTAVDLDFHMPAKAKLNAVAIRNNTASAMTILISTDTFDICEIELPASGDVDTDIGMTIWTAQNLHVTGVTGSITLLIDRK